MRRLLGLEIVVGRARRLQADLGAAPERARRRERDDGDIDPGPGHVLDARVEIEMRRLERAEAGAPAVNRDRAVEALLDLQIRATVGAQQIQPAVGEHVGVYVDNGGHRSLPLLSTRLH